MSSRRNRLATGWRASSRLDRGGVADEQQPDLQVPRRDERAIDDDGRPGVAAHGVDRDAHELAQLTLLTGLDTCRSGL